MGATIVNKLLNFTTIFFFFLHSTISLILKRLVTTSYVSRHSKLEINSESKSIPRMGTSMNTISI